MAKTFRYQHLRTNSPGSIPSSTEIREGEIAVNLAKGVEKLFLKNTNDEIIKFIPEAQIDAKIASQSGSTDAKVNTLTNSINSVSGAVNTLNTKVDGVSSATNTAIATEETRAAAAEAVLTTNLANEVTARTKAVSDEESRAVTAESNLNNAIINEAAARASAVSDEETRAKGVESTLSGNIEDNRSSINGLSSKTITEISSSNNSIESSTAATSNGTVKANIQTNASKISGLTAVSNSDEGAAKISGVTETDSVKKGIENLYKSISSEVAARKAAILARTIASANKAITVTETANADGFSTSLALTLDKSTNGANGNALAITNNGLFLSTDWICGDYE